MPPSFLVVVVVSKVDDGDCLTRFVQELVLLESDGPPSPPQYPTVMSAGRKAHGKPCLSRIGCRDAHSFFSQRERERDSVCCTRLLLPTNKSRLGWM